MRIWLSRLHALAGDLGSPLATQDGADPATITAWVAITLALFASAVALFSLRARRREQHRAEAALAEGARLSELFENARDVIFTLAPDGRIESVNQSIERITGQPAGGFIGRPLPELAAHPEDRRLLVEHLEKVRQHRSGGTTQFRIRSRGGDRVVELSSHGLPDEGPVRVIQGMARDVTMRKQLEQDKLQSEQLEAVGRLSGGIAHDLNNLLTIIRAHAERIREELQRHGEPGTREGTEAGLDSILRATRRAELLILQLLGHSRRASQESALLDLHQVIRTAMHRLESILPEDIDCKLDLGADPPHVFADQGTIEQILLNLVLNARDAMPDGGELRIETRRHNLGESTVIDRVPVEAGSWIVVAVTDDGIGMDKSTANRIFEPFFTTKNPSRGTGLGLATVRSALTRMGGHVMVTSQPGHGTRITLYLPWSDRIPTPAAEPGSQGGSEHVLLVEDDGHVREVFDQALTAAGYRVTTARCGEQAMAFEPQVLDSVEALVTDGCLTGMSGSDLADRLRDRLPDLVTVLLSGPPPRQPTPGLRFLKKPLATGRLIRELRLLLDERAAGTSAAAPFTEAADPAPDHATDTGA